MIPEYQDRLRYGNHKYLILGIIQKNVITGNEYNRFCTNTTNEKTIYLLLDSIAAHIYSKYSQYKSYTA